jgi:hypothetical protein
VLTAGYQTISMPSNTEYFQGSMFIVDQTAGGHIGMMKASYKYCISDFTIDLIALTANITTRSACKIFYLGAYVTTDLFYSYAATYHLYSTPGEYNIVASFLNYNNTMLSEEESIMVYGKFLRKMILYQ